jgi:ferritin-like protein
MHGYEGETYYTYPRVDNACFGGGVSRRFGDEDRYSRSYHRKMVVFFICDKDSEAIKILKIFWDNKASSREIIPKDQKIKNLIN